MHVVKRRPDVGYLDGNLWVPKSSVNVEGIKTALTFTTFDRQNIRSFELWRETAHHLLLPREFWNPEELDFPVIDCRPRRFEHVDIRSNIQLDHLPVNGVLTPTGKTVQREALQSLLAARGGILQLACGKGKTIIFLEFVARVQVPTLIVIDNTQLLAQWQKEIEAHLQVPGGVGLIQGDVFDWKKAIVMTTYQTLALRADTFPEQARRWFGLVGWDEGHHLAAPTFCKGADLFLGRRILLTATPDRDDGMHVVYNHHVGPVLYKDLTQELRPRIYFKWTGLSLDKSNPISRALTEDKNGELHIGKLAGYLGQWKERLDLILSLVTEALNGGRKVLVLSNSIDELVNLKALWDKQALYTDLVPPTPKDVGEVVMPVELSPAELAKTERSIWALRGQLADPSLNGTKRQTLSTRLREVENLLASYECWKKIDTIHRKNQRAYVKKLVAAPSNAGLMIYQVSTTIRSRLLKEKDVVFAVSKYGREGLDSPDLDTIITCEPMSSRNALQQFMGRVLRKKAGKKSPVVVFLEDDIGPMIGMCQNLRRHLRDWPVEESGPYEYTNVDHPKSFSLKGKQWTQNVVVFGQ